MAIDQLFLRAGLRGPAPAITSLNFHANLRLAAQGGLLAVAPRSVFKTVASVLERLPIPVDWGDQDSGIVLAWRESSVRHPALAALQTCF
jgi:DNA-binding transcriptional LysR family regulator